MCKVSVIVPLYNGEKTIARCLDSLIGQKLKDIEILVVNDGSQDGGEKVVLDYMKKDSRIRMISQVNQGQGAARNHGVRSARGQYVSFVDCDDFVDSKMLSLMIAALEETGTKVAICQEKNVYEEKGSIQTINETHFPVAKAVALDNTTILKWLFNYTYMSLNSMCYKVIEREVFLNSGIKFPEKHRYAEDLVTSVGILTHIEKAVIVPKSLYFYVHDKSSFTYEYSLKHAKDIYLDLVDVRDYVKKEKCTIKIDNFSLGMYFSSLKQIYWSPVQDDEFAASSRKLIRRWERERKTMEWKPDFKGSDMPFLHKIKICVAYFHLCRWVFALIKVLNWIPLFKYMA